MGASEAWRQVHVDDTKLATRLLQAMEVTLDPTQMSEIMRLTGTEPGGCSGSDVRAIDIPIVFNTLKRVIGYSELVRKNKAIKDTLAKSVEKAAKQAFDVLVAEETSGGGAVAEIIGKLSEVKIQRADLPRNKLGTEHARSVYEAIIGDLDDTIKYVQHNEIPAPIDLFANHSNGAAPSAEPADGDACNAGKSTTEPGSLPVVILRYSQTKHWFKEALLEGDDLLAERNALEQAGFSAKLDSGAKVFVRPEVFELLVDHLTRQGYSLKTSHVVIELALEEKIRTIIDAARTRYSKRERGTSKVTNRVEAHIATPCPEAPEGSVEPDWNSFVKHTLIHVPVPSSMLSTLSAHAETA